MLLLCCTYKVFICCLSTFEGKENFNEPTVAFKLMLCFVHLKFSFTPENCKKQNKNSGEHCSHSIQFNPTCDHTLFLRKNILYINHPWIDNFRWAFYKPNINTFIHSTYSMFKFYVLSNHRTTVQLNELHKRKQVWR